MSKLIDDFKAYTDKHGLVGLEPGRSSQNGALFTMEYVINLIHDPNTTMQEMALEIIRLKKVFASLERHPGVTSRVPDDPSFNESMDNAIANITFSALFNKSALARRLKYHGEDVECTGVHPKYAELNNKFYKLASLMTFFQLPITKLPAFIRNKFRPRYFWNNVSPTEFNVRSWFGKSPGFLGAIDIAATGRTTPFRWFALMVGQFIGCFEPVGNTNDRKLPYITWFLLVYKTKGIMGLIHRTLYRLWVYILMKQYPNGMQDVYSIYYKKSHPINSHSVKFFVFK